MGNFTVDGRNAIVTGASEGLGTCIAEELAGAGANVSVCSRSQNRVGPFIEAINEAGGRSTFVNGQTSTPREVLRPGFKSGDNLGTEE